jgi:F-type H+-transporting ATPase subunit gamma
MQMISTAKYQKSLKRTIGTKPYTQKIRELVHQLASSVGEVEHPLLRVPDEHSRTNRIAVIVFTSNRGLAGAYNSNVLRTATSFLREQEAAGKQIDLYVIGKKAASYFQFQKRPIYRRNEFKDAPTFAETLPFSQDIIDRFVSGEIDAAYVVYMDFISAGTQRPNVLKLLPLGEASEAVERISRDLAQKEEQARRGVMDTTHSGEGVTAAAHQYDTQTIYDFSPDPKTLLDELLPLTVRTAVFQTFLDATTSEHVARMVAMKSATDNAEKMVKSLTLQYNRARQGQITTELSEIIAGAEAAKG